MPQIPSAQIAPFQSLNSQRYIPRWRGSAFLFWIVGTGWQRASSSQLQK
jgi:hypothetical protein